MWSIDTLRRDGIGSRGVRPLGARSDTIAGHRVPDTIAPDVRVRNPRHTVESRHAVSPFARHLTRRVSQHRRSPPRPDGPVHACRRFAHDTGRGAPVLPHPPGGIVRSRPADAVHLHVGCPPPRPGGSPRLRTGTARSARRTAHRLRSADTARAPASGAAGLPAWGARRAPPGRRVNSRYLAESHRGAGSGNAAPSMSVFLPVAHPERAFRSIHESHASSPGGVRRSSPRALPVLGGC